MTSSGYLSPKEALEALGLFNPDTDKVPYTRYLLWLNKRGLLNRHRTGYRSIIYKKSDCVKLFERSKAEGINLKQKI